QAADPRAHRRVRPRAVQPQGLRRGLDRRDHGQRRPHPRRLLQPLQDQGRPVRGSGGGLPGLQSARALAAAGFRSRAPRQRVRPPDGRRLPLARTLGRRRGPVPDDRPALRRGACRHRRETCLPRTAGTHGRHARARRRGIRRRGGRTSARTRARCTVRGRHGAGAHHRGRRLPRGNPRGGTRHGARTDRLSRAARSGITCRPPRTWHVCASASVADGAHSHALSATSKQANSNGRRHCVDFDPQTHRHPEPAMPRNRKPRLTTVAGAPVPDNQNTLTAGPRGPALLQDVWLLEKLAHFDREVIPERRMHAKGSGAFGTFTVTKDITKYTRAKIFSKVGKQTELFARFTTVAGERGAADAERDIRGFALKFYTEEGNWDLVGNNTPVFFFRDPLKFPDLNHAVKRNPRTNLRS